MIVKNNEFIFLLNQLAVLPSPFGLFSFYRGERLSIKGCTANLFIQELFPAQSL
jgi:hypothetical protein